jgi:hypothetical protein
MKRKYALGANLKLFQVLAEVGVYSCLNAAKGSRGRQGARNAELVPNQGVKTKFAPHATI